MSYFIIDKYDSVSYNVYVIICRIIRGGYIMKFCENCGKELSGEKFCTGCGKEIIYDDNTINKTTDAKINVDESNTFNVSNVAKNNIFLNILKLPRKYLLAGGIAIIGIIVMVVILLSDSGPNFKKIYNKQCNSIWADVGSDGSYLSIDTNPYDEEDNGIAYYESYTAIENINRELGLPESLFEAMGNTSGNDGKQSEEFDKIIVSWKYHPDTGMEVIYRKK